MLVRDIQEVRIAQTQYSRVFSECDEVASNLLLRRAECRHGFDYANLKRVRTLMEGDIVSTTSHS